MDSVEDRVELLNYAYPILDAGHEAKPCRIMEYLSSFKNLRLTGRNSLFQYTHFHDMMQAGRRVIDSLQMSEVK